MCVNVYICVHVSLSLPVYQVRLNCLPLPLVRPSQLNCLGSSVGRASASSMA